MLKGDTYNKSKHAVLSIRKFLYDIISFISW